MGGRPGEERHRLAGLTVFQRNAIIALGTVNTPRRRPLAEVLHDPRPLFAPMRLGLGRCRFPRPPPLKLPGTARSLNS